MAIKLGFSMDDLHFFSIKDITEMFNIYAETLPSLDAKPKSTYSGAKGLLDFVGGR